MDSRPPPPVPPRHDPQSGPSTPSQNGAGGAPLVPLNSRPTSIAASPGPSQSPALLEHGPSRSTYHSQATSSNLAASRPVPVQSSYPGQHTSAPQLPSQYSQDTSAGSSSYTRPTVQLPTPNFTSLPQPASPWSSQPSAPPMWPPQDWNYPSQSLPPSQFPVPPIQAPYGYPSGYGESIAFPEAMRPAGPADYGFTIPQATAILEPQQFNPGPPPPLQPRPHNTLPELTLLPPQPRPSSTRLSPPPTHPTSNRLSPRPGDFPPPPTRVHSSASPSPPQAPGQDLPARARSLARGMADKALSSSSGSESGSGYTGGDTTRRESIMKRGLGSVSAAGSKVFGKFTK